MSQWIRKTTGKTNQQKNLGKGMVGRLLALLLILTLLLPQTGIAYGAEERFVTPMDTTGQSDYMKYEIRLYDYKQGQNGGNESQGNGAQEEEPVESWTNSPIWGHPVFNLRGVDGSKSLKTTYEDMGYTVVSKVDGVQVDWTGANVAMGKSLYGNFKIELVYNGRYAKVTYQVENTGSEPQSFQVGSSADVMIHNNDRAPVVGNATGLHMDGGKKNDYEFNLVAPNATTLWYGHYSNAYQNVFTNKEDRTEEYKRDSGMSWSFSAVVAPGQVWSDYVLIGVGALPTTDMPRIGVEIPSVIEGEQETVSGSAKPGDTVYIYFGGEEYTDVADQDGSFSVEIQTPDQVDGTELELQYWAVSPEGGMSPVGTSIIPVQQDPELELTHTAYTVEEDTVLTEAWYQQFIKRSVGTVTYGIAAEGAAPVVDPQLTAMPGTKTITYQAVSAGKTVTRTLTLEVTHRPLELTPTEAAEPNETEATVELSATLRYTGGLTIVESGFVWGIMQNPTLTLNNGKQTMASPVTEKQDVLRVTAEDIVDGVNYYARAYVKTDDDTVYYADQDSFSIHGKSYGTFSVTNNGDNTFTIHRTGGTDDAQTVYFRTVNGTAFGGAAGDTGVHFVHQVGSVIFADGETSKTVTITENNINAVYGNVNSTAYTQNGQRTYQLEIYRVDGGGMLSTQESERFATRTMVGGKTVGADVYTKWISQDQNSGTHEVKGNQGTEFKSRYTVSFDRQWPYDNSLEYLKATSSYYAWYQTMSLKEDYDCWAHLRFTTNTGIVDQWTFAIYDGHKQGDYTNENHIPHSGTTQKTSKFTHEKTGLTFVSDGNYLLVPNNVSSISVGGAATGSGSDQWWMKNIIQYARPYDNVEPTLKGIAPMAATTYKAGDKVTVSVVFDEIVDECANLSLNTSWGTFAYAGGLGTNVLYFTATVPANASGGLCVNSLSIGTGGYLLDMCDDARGTATVSMSAATLGVSVDTKTPAVSITNSSNENGTARATVIGTNTDVLQYTWSQQDVMPLTGWLTCTNGETVVTRQTEGVWYLHLLGTYNGTGKTAYTNQGFAFTAQGQEASVLPSLQVATDNSQWARERSISIEKTAAAGGTLTMKWPDGTVDTLEETAQAVTVTANGAYTFTLICGQESIVRSVTVSRIDRENPVVSVTGPSNLVHSENVRLEITASDGNGSGIHEFTGAWSKVTEGEPQQILAQIYQDPAVGTWWAKTPGIDGENGQWQLTVQAVDLAGNRSEAAASAVYTVNRKLPIITVQEMESTAQGVTYQYTVSANGNTVTNISLPDGTRTTDVTGSFRLTTPGEYYVTVSDAAGHVVTSETITVAATTTGGIAIDGLAPIIRLEKDLDVPTNQPLTIYVSVLEEGGIASGVWYAEEDAADATRHHGFTPMEWHDGYEGEGVYELTFCVSVNTTYVVEVTDQAGNRSQARLTVDNLDFQQPMVTLTGVPFGWQNEAVSISVTYRDQEPAAEGGEASGIATGRCAWVEAAAGGGIPSAPTGDQLLALPASGEAVSLTQDGIWHLYYQVTDVAGNQASGFSDAVFLDQTVPLFTVVTEDTAQAKAEGVDCVITVTDFGVSGAKLKVKEPSGSEREVTTFAQVGETCLYTAEEAGEYVFTAYNEAGLSSQKTVNIYGVTIDHQNEQSMVELLAAEGAKISAPDPAPVRRGHTLLGWYADIPDVLWNFEEDTVNGQRELLASWETNIYPVTYHLTDFTAEARESSYTYGVGVTLPQPEKEGYVFSGWFENDQYTGKEITGIGTDEIEGRTYYGYWNQIPQIHAELTDNGIETVWYRADNAPDIRLVYSDDVSVDQVQVSVDDAAMEIVPGAPVGAGTAMDTVFAYKGLLEGEHEYAFRATDNEGVSEDAQVVTVKLDTTKPILGTITYEEKVMSFWDWLFGREKMVILVPVTESGSGVSTLEYELVTEDKVENKTSEIVEADGIWQAQIIVEADWQGMIRNIHCEDAAGNVSDSKSIGTVSENCVNSGILVEDNAPKISVENVPAGTDEIGWISDRYRAKVTVSDSLDQAITSGLRQITWQWNQGEAQTIAGGDLEKSAVDHYEFFVETQTGGENLLQITAVDNVGNRSTLMLKVKISKMEPTPQATPQFADGMLTGLVPDQWYRIDEKNYITDHLGRIPIEEEWLDGDLISIVRLGDGGSSRDSFPLDILMPTREELIAAGIIPGGAGSGDSKKENEEIPEADGDKLDLDGQDSLDTDIPSAEDPATNPEKDTNPEEDAQGNTERPNHDEGSSEETLDPIEQGHPGEEADDEDEAESSGIVVREKCGLCHRCPTFLGICVFIWLLLLLICAGIVVWMLHRKKREKAEKDQEQ